MAPQDRKSVILDATEALLLEIGNAELTMRKVAARAGISLGNLQYHFATREDLLLALLLRFLEPYEENLKQRTTEGASDLTTAAQDLFLEVLTHPDFERYSIVFKEIWAAATHSEDIRTALDAYYARLATFYRSVMEQSGVSPEQAERAVLILLPLVEGACVTRRVLNKTDKELARLWARTLAPIFERNS